MTWKAVDRWFALYGARPILRLGCLTGRPRIPILMYHSIAEDSETGVAMYYKLCTPPSLFSSHMSMLKNAGFQTIAPGAAVTAASETGTGRTGRKTALTFDDGFSDIFTNALPILESMGFTATVYLATAYIGDERRVFKGRSCLTWPEILEMKDRGIRFGSHTVTHPVLYGMRWDDIRNELRDSRQEIEDRLQVQTVSFSYPYAFPQEDRDFVARLKDALHETGYRDGVTTRIGRVGPQDDLLTLKRLPVNSGDDDRLFSAKLEGAYDPLAFGQSLHRRLRHKVPREGTTPGTPLEG
jgi:peptidoglycan/xylan/chitin deacetylase (PgdA/CDA1 family)